jgi:FkbM family methyltransferase
MNAIFYPDVPFESLYIPHILKEIYIDKVFAKVKPCNVIVDVGANIGLTAMYLRNFAKKVYAIEPANIHYECLVENIEYAGEFLTDKTWDNVEPFNIAISKENGFFSLYLNQQNQTMHSLVWKNEFIQPIGDGKGGYSKQFVNCKTFARFMNDEKIETIDFCKLDVEGAEEAILLGEGFISVADRIKSLLVEFHNPSRVSFLLDHMTMIGYLYENVPADSILYWFERP